MPAEPGSLLRGQAAGSSSTWSPFMLLGPSTQALSPGARRSSLRAVRTPASSQRLSETHFGQSFSPVECRMPGTRGAHLRASTDIPGFPCFSALTSWPGADHVVVNPAAPGRPRTHAAGGWRGEDGGGRLVPLLPSGAFTLRKH